MQAIPYGQLLYHIERRLIQVGILFGSILHQGYLYLAYKLLGPMAFVSCILIAYQNRKLYRKVMLIATLYLIQLFV
jgi:hypothetical protein